MPSKCFVRRLLRVVPTVMLLGYSSECILLSANAQTDSGVKIELTLTPSKPEGGTKEKPASTPEKEAKKLAPSDAAPQSPRPFVLSAFKLPSDKQPSDKQPSDKQPSDSSANNKADADAKAKPAAPDAKPLGALVLEQPPSPAAKPKKLEHDLPPKSLAGESSDTANAAANKTTEGSQKPSDIKPQKINEPTTKKLRSDEDNEDATGAECPGGADSAKPLPVLPDDVPLQEEDHPYDAPAAESTLTKPDRPESKKPLALNGDQLRLRTEINQLLRYYMQHPETIARRSPWAVMHAILPYGVEAELSAGNRRVNAIGWMSYNGLCKTQRIFQPTKSGFRTNLGPGVQGHEGQFLAILAQSKVGPTYPLKVGPRTYTVNDLVRYEMATCREKSELTFKLIGLSYYLDPDQRWRDNQGGTWSLEKMVGEELDQPIVGSACGGTHRLMGLTFSLLQRKQAGLPIDGHWNRSEQFLNEFVAYAFSLQNPDGSFSTDWFEARANDPDIERKVQTTGHILEWLIYTLPDDQLQSPPVQKAIRFLLSTIGAEPGRDWPIGPRGHSLRALALYNQRVFGAEPGKLKQYMANLNSETKQR